MGGAVCLLAARRLGDQVRGVVAVDALHDVERQLTAEEVAQMVRPFEADFPGACELFVRKMFPRNSDSAVVESTIAATRRTSPEAGIALIRSHVTFSTRDALADCPAPVHCINSVAMDTEIERNRRYSTQFGVTLMTEVGHFPMLERPHEFNRHLETVLARLSAESID